jgi:hypothetical protein
VRDTMRIDVLEADAQLEHLRVSEVAAPATDFPYQTCVVGSAGEVRCLRPPEQPLRDEASRDLFVFRAPGGRRLTGWSLERPMSVRSMMRNGPSAGVATNGAS